MTVTGLVTRVVRRGTPHGSRYFAVTIKRPGTHDITLKYLHGFEPEPARGQTITIEGMPMVGFPRVNIGGISVTIHHE